jgi:hypothetical protein
MLALWKPRESESVVCVFLSDDIRHFDWRVTWISGARYVVHREFQACAQRICENAR